MIIEVFTQYLESVAAFWQGLAGGGHLRLILIGLAIWWFWCRKGRGCCACGHCGCRCGHCKCDDDEDK